MTKSVRRSVRLAAQGLLHASLMCPFQSLANANANADTNFIDPAFTAEGHAMPQLNAVMNVQGGKPASLLDAHFLFASLLCGSVAGGYLLYAKKKREIALFLGGVAMAGASFLITSWFWMSVVCLALMVEVYQYMKRRG